MAQFAPVCPIHIMHGLRRAGQMGTYHLPLAHDVLNNQAQYMEIFSRGNRARNMTVILDNSVIELGSAVNIDAIVTAARIVSATVIVLPDVLLDTDATIHSCQSALEPWARILDIALGKDNWSFMVVPQGKTPQDFARCAEAFAGNDLIGWWGIPRNYNIHGLGSRRDAVEICSAIDSENQIHLLGFSDNIIDDVLSARTLDVLGIDSAVPIRAASLGCKMSMALDADLPPRGTWWDDPNTQYVNLMSENVKTIRRWVA